MCQADLALRRIQLILERAKSASHLEKDFMKDPREVKIFLSVTVYETNFTTSSILLQNVVISLNTQ